MPRIPFPVDWKVRSGDNIRITAALYISVTGLKTVTDIGIPDQIYYSQVNHHLKYATRIQNSLINKLEPTFVQKTHAQCPKFPNQCSFPAVLIIQR
jgi:hypothetical protein